MPSKIDLPRIVILWEHELIIAAKALHRLKAEDATDEDYRNAIKACWTALYHKDLVDDNPNPVTIMAAHMPEERRVAK